MRRLCPILLRIFAAGLIGAAVTVGVAVGCAMAKSTIPIRTGLWKLWSDPNSGCSIRFVPRGAAWGSTSVMVLPEQPPPVDGFRFTEPADRPPAPLEALRRMQAMRARTVRIVGWPSACAWGAVEAGAEGFVNLNGTLPPNPLLPSPVSALYVGRTLDENDPRGVWGYLPIAPIWPGLAINTLFYGTIAWLLVFLPGTLRRWRRRRGGRCVKCGYDLKGLAAGAACPECGGSATR